MMMPSANRGIDAIFSDSGSEACLLGIVALDATFNLLASQLARAVC